MYISYKALVISDKVLTTLPITTPLKDVPTDFCYLHLLIDGENRYINVKLLPKFNDLDVPINQVFSLESLEQYYYITDINAVLNNTVKQHGLDLIKYTFKPVDSSRSINDDYPIETCTDLMLKTSTPDFETYVANNILFSVNGYIHRSYPVSNSVIIKDANKTYLASRSIEIAALAFDLLGGVTTWDIDESVIFDINLNSAYIKLPQPIGDNRTPFIVLLGKLHLLNSDNTFIKLISDDLIKVNLDRLPEELLKAIYLKIIKPEDVGLNTDDTGNMLTSEILNVNCLRNLLLHSFTYGGFINRRNTYVRKIPLKRIRDSNVAVVNNFKQNVLMNALGEVLPYIVEKNDLPNKSIYIPYTCLGEKFLIDEQNWRKDLLVKPRLKSNKRFDDEELFEVIIYGE